MISPERKLKPAPAPAPPRIKICGMTREEDGRAAVSARADYLGLVFAESPRRVSVDAARRLARSLPAARWVGVFAGSPVEEILETARAVPLTIVQLHGEADDTAVSGVAAAGLEIWRAVPVGDAGDWEEVEERLAKLAGRVDALVLDRAVGGRAGGGGVPFDWKAMPSKARARLERTRFVLSGGLSAENVGLAIGLLRPDVVDVSSGVEAFPGRKDPDRIVRFVRAARAAAAAEYGAVQ